MLHTGVPHLDTRLVHMFKFTVHIKNKYINDIVVKLHVKSQRNKAIQMVIHVPGICLNLVPKMRTSSMIHDVAFSLLYFDPHQNPIHNQTYFLRK